MPGITCEIASSVAIEPLMMLMKSIVPVRASVDAIATPSASVSPPATSSPPVIRIPTMKSSPTARPDRLEDLDREAHPVLERAAVAIARAR